MTRKPNILFIVADDLNAWIGALGRHPDVRTPAIDTLAERGTLFTNAYCPAPYCNASRMSVFTGCNPATTGVYQNEPFWDRRRRRTTFVEHLREMGYHTTGAGKVFHGAFDYAAATREAARAAPWQEAQNRPDLWDSFNSCVTDPLPGARPVNGMFDYGRPDEVSPWNFHFDWGRLPDDAVGDMPDEMVCETVSDFLAAPPAEPFFCAAGLYKPHLPWYVPGRFFDLYPLDAVTLPCVKEDDLDDVPEIARGWALTPPDHETVTRHGQWRHAVQGYLAAISYCDDVVGRILRALEGSPARDNTIVVLWGDNGFHLGEKLHWRKFVLWEEATRVPMIVCPPAGEAVVPRVDAPVSLADLFPTIFEMCGFDVPRRLDGVSLVPEMQAADPKPRPPVVMTWQRGNHSVRHENWRYTRYRDGSEELYDLATDPYEWTNLAGDRRFRAQRKRLRRSLPRD